MLQRLPVVRTRSIWSFLSSQNRIQGSLTYLPSTFNFHQTTITYPLLQFSSKQSYSPNKIKQDARSMLDEKKNPLGSFKAMQYDQARLILEDLTESKKRIDAESVNLSLALVNRLVRETVVHEDKKHTKWLCQSSFVARLLSNWDTAMRAKKKVITAKELFLQLETMSKVLPSFRLDIGVFETIMNAAVRRESRQNAPIVAEEWFGRIRAAGFVPNHLLYNCVLFAWSKSQLPSAAEKVETIFRSMLKENKPSNVATFEVLKNFWGGENACNDKINEILDDLNNEMVPNFACLNERLYCFVRQGLPEEADKVLQKMAQQQNVDNNEERKLIGSAAQKILAAYRSIITKSTITEKERDHYIEKAEDFFYRMELVHSIADGGLSDKLVGAMMDIYARVGRTVNVENLFQRIRPNRVTYNILMRSLRGDIDKATALFYRMLNDPSIPPDIASFSTIINEWTESSRPDAYENVTKVFRLLNEHPKCVEQNLRANTRTYNAVLKCLSKFNVANAGKQAVELLNTMEERCKTDGRDPRPDEYTFCLVIKALLKDGDISGAESILERMSKSSYCAVNLQAYTEFLMHYGHQNNPATAERAEQILHYMKVLAKNGKPELQPTIVEYHAATMAWTRAGVPHSTDRAWNLFQMMKADNILPNFNTYTSLLMSFCKIRKPKSMEKANYLLSCMENSQDLQPNTRHYTAVIKGWIDLGEAEMAMRVLIRSAELCVKNRDKNQAPGAVIIDMTMQCVAKSGDLPRATALIEKLLELKDRNLLPVGPEPRTILSLLNFWKKSNHINRRSQVEKLEKMHDAMNRSSAHIFKTAMEFS